MPINGEHLNSMDGAADGRRILVGEMGLVLRTQDGGATWEQVELSMTAHCSVSRGLPGVAGWPTACAAMCL